MGGAKPTSGRAKAPRWARLCAIFGSLLMVLAGGVLVTSQVLVARYAGSVQTEDLFEPDPAAAAPKEKTSDIKGPLNFLLVGIDPRDPDTPPLADSIMVVHVPAGLQSAYVFSIPRDTYVQIPPFPKNGFGGSREKINAAMGYGSRIQGRQPSAAQGFALLSKTVSKLTGIQQFDAGAIINFDGFKNVVDEMGGVDMYIDERTKSEHLQPDGSPRPHRPRYAGDPHPYRGEQKVYEVGNTHLKGWEALDFVRQRYGLEGTDYARQRHQQQFLKAMTQKVLSADVLMNPVKLDGVLQAAGKSLIFDGRGRTVVDFAMALKSLRSDSLTMIKIKGGGIGTGNAYKGEQLSQGTEELFEAVAESRVEQFLLEHPEFVADSK
jgi:LCP family protein required for cell wall assembly